MRVWLPRGLLLAALLGGALLAASEGPALMARLQLWLAALQGVGPAGWLAFMLVQAAVAAFGIVPASLMGAAAGAVYGVPLGFVLAAAATMAGAAVSFRLSRSAFRPLVLRLLARRQGLARMDAALGREGWRLVCLLRVNPVMPFAPTSFLLGLSGVSARDYMLGTLAALPALLLFVAMGGAAGAGMAAWAEGGTWRLVLLVVGAVALAGLSVRLGWLAARAGLLPGAEGAAKRS